MNTRQPVTLVALLRGINVGGKNKINMQDLKRAFAQAGLENVSTYINSGNILFQHQGDDEPAGPATADPRYRGLATRLESVIRSEFGLEVPVVLRDVEQYRLVVDALPETWSNDANTKSDVMFLWSDIDTPDVLEKLPVKPDIDTVHYVPGAVLWSVPKAVLTRSGLMKLAGTSLYKRMTVRNVNTTRKIWELMQDMVD